MSKNNMTKEVITGTYADTDSVKPTEKAAADIQPNDPSTSGKTPNYGLPQWAGSDITDWFELNPAFEKIDEVMKANADAVDTAQSTGDSNTVSISNLTQSLNGTIARVTEVENTNAQQGQQITLNTTHLNEHDTAIQTMSTAVTALRSEVNEIDGDVAANTADVAKLQQDLTVAQGNISTNADAIGNLTDLNTTAKSNLVAAVNEIVEGTGTGTGGLSDELVGIGMKEGIATLNSAHPASFLLEIEYTGESGGITPHFTIEMMLPNRLFSYMLESSSNPYTIKKASLPAGYGDTLSDIRVRVETLDNNFFIMKTAGATAVTAESYQQLNIENVQSKSDRGVSKLIISCNKQGSPVTEGRVYHFGILVTIYNTHNTDFINLIKNNITQGLPGIKISKGTLKILNAEMNNLALGSPLI